MRPAISTALALVLAVGLGLIAAAPSLSQIPSAPDDPQTQATEPAAASATTPEAPRPYSSLRPQPAHHAAPAAPHRPVAAPPAAPAAQPQTPPPPTAATPIPPATLEAFVDGIMAQAMPRQHLAGVVVAVVQNGQVVLKKGYGFAAPGRLVDPDRTLFRLGGISSTFTWITLMKEVEAGRIRLDAPINLYLPEPLQVHDQGFHRPVLVRDLMSHSAGFEDRTLGQLFEQDPQRVRPLSDYLREERPRRVREPGELPSYSPYGAALAGAAISYVETHPYQDTVEADLLRPLGLSHTSLREPYPARSDLPAAMPAALAGDLATGYRWRHGEFEPQGFEYATQIAPAEAASSTAGDMARYMTVLLADGQADGASLYSPATAKAFRTVQLAGAPGVGGWDDGFQEFALPGGYRGQGQTGDTLAFHASLVTIPALNLGIFVAGNTVGGAGLADGLPGQIVGRFYAAPQAEPRAGSAALAQAPEVYAGAYLTTRRPYAGLGKFLFTLAGQVQVSVTPDGRLLTRGADQKETWVPDGDAGRFMAAQGAAVSAFSLEDGLAQRWFPPSGTEAFDRVGPLYQIPTLLGLALATLLASLATLFGQFTRDPREFRQTGSQRRAGLLQTTIAVLWLIVFVAFGVWLTRAGDAARLMYHWPGTSLLVASACAFVAAVLSLLCLGLSPWIWRGGRRLDSWSAWRKLQFTATTLIFIGFSVVLGLWGALEPWSR